MGCVSAERERGRVCLHTHPTQTPPSHPCLCLPVPLTQPRSFQSIFTEYQGRVEACWEESAAIQACKAQADALYTAMLETPIQDARLSVAGEQNRIMSRAHAMLDVLVKQDRTVAEMCGPSRSQQGGGVGVNAHAPSTTPSPPQQPAYSAPAQVSPAQAAAPPPPPVVTAAEASAYSSAHTVNRLYPFNTAAAPHPSRHNRPPSVPEDAPLPSASSPDAPGSPDQQQEGQQPPHQHHKVHIERSSNEEVPDATPEECLLSVCMMLAALYEQTPFSETELRRRVFDDFTQLKRHFRSDDLTVMHGRTGSIKELFDSIKVSCVVDSILDECCCWDVASVCVVLNGGGGPNAFHLLYASGAGQEQGPAKLAGHPVRGLEGQ